MKNYSGSKEENLHIEFDIPVRIIIKEKSKSCNDPLNQRSTYGWKFQYHDRTFGDYMTITDKLDPDFLKELHDLSIEYAEDVFIHNALLVDNSVDNMMGELEYRLRKKYFPIYAETRKKYTLVGLSGNERYPYRKKFSFRYLFMVVRFFVVRMFLKLVWRFCRE